MWAQSWIHIQRFALPYPELNNTDLTEALIKKVNHTINFLPGLSNISHKIRCIVYDTYTIQIVQDPAFFHRNTHPRSFSS